MNERQEKFGSNLEPLIDQISHLLDSLPNSREASIAKTEWEKTAILIAAMGLKALEQPAAT